MKATQLATLQRRLMEERERIVAEWKNHGGDTGSGDDWDMRDIEERAVQIASDTIDRRIAEDDRKLLRKVIFALQRLEDGTYTQCEHCNSQIPAARLVAKPSVSLCIGCQELKDAGRLQPA